MGLPERSCLGLHRKVWAGHEDPRPFYNGTQTLKYEHRLRWEGGGEPSAGPLDLPHFFRKFFASSHKGESAFGWVMPSFLTTPCILPAQASSLASQHLHRGKVTL